MIFIGETQNLGSKISINWEYFFNYKIYFFILNIDSCNWFKVENQ